MGDPAAGPRDGHLGAAIGRLLHTDDPDRLTLWMRLLTSDQPPQPEEMPTRERRLLRMLHTALFGETAPPDRLAADLQHLWAHPARREELAELAQVLRKRLRRITFPLPEQEVPLHIHARYQRYEVLRAFGDEARSFREGVKYIPHARADLFFVTLRKSEQYFSPTTMYADHAISPRLFQWESQSTTAENSPTAQRYIHHAARGHQVHLFLREHAEADGRLGAPAFFYAGPMTYLEHTGSRPVRFRWQLAYELPADVFRAAKVTAG